MTPQERKLIRRLVYICSELRAGNEFSESTLWKWEREAQEYLIGTAVAELERSRNS